jgi:hypothetical protein
LKYLSDRIVNNKSDDNDRQCEISSLLVCSNILHLRFLNAPLLSHSRFIQVILPMRIYDTGALWQRYYDDSQAKMRSSYKIVSSVSLVLDVWRV